MSIRLARLGLATCVAVAIPLAAQAQNANSSPHLVVSASEYDLGRLHPDDRRREIHLVVRNPGERTLEIRKVRTSCVCVRATLSTDKIAAGGTASLQLTIEPPAIEELVEEEVLVYSNDPDQPLSKIRVHGTVGTAIRLFPQPAFPVGFVHRSQLAGLQVPSVQLVAVDGAPLGQVSTIVSHPSIRAEIRRGDYSAYEVIIKIDDTIPLGPIKETVTIRTEHPAVPQINIPVLGTIEGDLDQRGRRIDFGLIKEGRPASVTFMLTNRGTREIEITRTDVHLPVPAEAQVTREGNAFRLVLRISSAPAFTQLSGQVELHTTHADEPIVRLPVAGGVLATQPFEQAAAGHSESDFQAIVNDALVRGERIPIDRFFTDVLGGVRDARASAVLLRALAEGSLQMRMRAVELLAELKRPEVLDELRGTITDDQEPFVRRLALVAYADAVGKSAVPVLLLALKDDDDWVREDAATYLGKARDVRAIPALRAALNDPDPEAGAAVREALAALQAIAAK